MPDRRPRHEILKHLLLNHLAANGFGVGARFPSQNELMKTYGLGYATVTRALNGLEADGWLSREQGRGTFVRAVPTPADLARARPIRMVTVLAEGDFPHFGGPGADEGFAALLSAALPDGWNTTAVAYPAADAGLARHAVSRTSGDFLVFHHPTPGQAAMARRLAASLPVVVAGDDPGPAPGLGRVCRDSGEAARIATEFLLEAGHLDIAFVLAGGARGESGGAPDSEVLLEGYRSALPPAGVAYRESLVMTAAGGDGHGALLDLFDRNSDTAITAVIAADVGLAIGALSAARSMGLPVPQGLSVISLGDSAEAVFTTPPLTIAGAPARAVANAVAAILGAMAEGAGGAERIDIGAVLTVRGSTGPAPGK